MKIDVPTEWLGVRILLQDEADAIDVVLALEALRLGVRKQVDWTPVQVVHEGSGTRSFHSETNGRRVLHLCDRSLDAILKFVVEVAVEGAATVDHIDEELDEKHGDRTFDVCVRFDGAGRRRPM